MYSQIGKKLDSIIRGGMRTLFHIPDDVHRLSNDIDLMTSLTISQVSDIMNGIHLNDMNVYFHHTSKRLPNNLISYHVTYASCLGGDAEIKLDILCGVDPRVIQNSEVSSATIFNINFENCLILTKGTLIADKMTTLSNPEYLGISKSEDLPKQIYDLCNLLKESKFDDLLMFFKVYPIIIKFKTDMECVQRTTSEIVNDIYDTINTFLDFNNSNFLNHDYSDNYLYFKKRFLKNSIPLVSSLNDILFVLLHIKHMCEYENDHNMETHCHDLIDIHDTYDLLDDASNDLNIIYKKFPRDSYTLPNQIQRYFFQSPITTQYLLLEIFAEPITDNTL